MWVTYTCPKGGTQTFEGHGLNGALKPYTLHHNRTPVTPTFIQRCLAPASHTLTIGRLRIARHNVKSQLRTGSPTKGPRMRYTHTADVLACTPTCT